MHFIYLLSYTLMLNFFSPENLFVPREVQSLIVKSDVCELTKSADEYVSLAENYHAKALYFLAIENYSCAIQIDPQRTKLYLLRGNELRVVGQFERSIDDFRKFQLVEPSNFISYALIAWTYLDQANYTDALTEINNALKLKPSEAWIYMLQGQIYVGLNNKSKALESFNQYIQTQTIPVAKANGYAEIGFTYEHFGEPIVALIYLKKAVDISPNLGNYYLGVAQEYRVRSNFEMALDNLNKAIRLTPDLIAAYFQRAAVNGELKYTTNALLDCNIIIQLQPQKPDGYACRGIMYAQIRNYTQAVDDFNHSIQLDENYVSAYAGRALAESNMRNYDAALSDINFAINAEPLVSYNYQIRASVYTSLNKVSEAIADYETYLHLQGGALINPDIVNKIHQLKEKIANL